MKNVVASLVGRPDSLARVALSAIAVTGLATFLMFLIACAGETVGIRVIWHPGSPAATQTIDFAVTGYHAVVQSHLVRPDPFRDLAPVGTRVAPWAEGRIDAGEPRLRGYPSPPTVLPGHWADLWAVGVSQPRFGPPGSYSGRIDLFYLPFPSVAAFIFVCAICLVRLTATAIGWVGARSARHGRAGFPIKTD